MLKIDEVIAELRDNNLLLPEKVAEAQKALQKLEEDKKEERSENKAPKTKNQFVILLDSSATTGHVVQIPDGEDPSTTIDRLKRAAKKQNTMMKKYIKSPLKTMGDALENLKRKYTKGEKVLIKTTSPVVALKHDNTL